MKSVYIFYPSNIVGGAEYLLKRAAEILSSKYSVCIIDKSDGWISSNINGFYKNRIKVKLFDGKKIKLEDESVILTASSLLFEFDNYFEKGSANVLLWTMQPHNLIPSISRLHLHKKSVLDISYYANELLMYKLRRSCIKFLKAAYSKASIYSMDEECDRVLNKYYKINHNGYLPVFVKLNNSLPIVKKVDLTESLKLLWIGRIDLTFKIHIILKLIKDLDFFSESSSIPVEFNIIGDGPGLSILEEVISGVTNLKVNLMGSKDEKGMSSLINNSHIGFAMGTSALEMGGRGLPTILLDFSYKEISYNYKYKLICESSGYMIGRCIDDFSEFEKNDGTLLNELIPAIINDYDYLSHKCREYVIQNHSNENTKIKLIDAIDGTALTMTECLSFAEDNRPLWRTLLRWFKRRLTVG